jgi:hypothetical protein
MSVGVTVNVRVGRGTRVGEAVAGMVAGINGVSMITSDVGVAYIPHREGVWPHDASKKAIMQNTNRYRFTSQPFHGLYTVVE